METTHGGCDSLKRSDPSMRRRSRMSCSGKTTPPNKALHSDRGRILVSRDTTSTWRPRRVNWIVRRKEVRVAHAFIVYVVPWEDLLETPGSRHPNQLAAITRVCGDRLDGLDRSFRDIEPPPSSREALRRIVYGEELAPGLGTLYAYAVEIICL